MSKKIKKGIIWALAVILLLGSVVTVKTLTFTSKQIPVDTKVNYPIDTEQVLARVSEGIQIPTVSNAGSIDYTQFTRFREFLEKSYPLVHSNLERKIINSYSLIYIWQGSNPQLKPILLMAHYDVFNVVDENAWKYPPFSGTIADGYIWGRGMIDDKASAIGLLEAMEYLLKSGFQTTRTIYVALGQDEEGGGRQGAQKEAEYLKSQGLLFETMIDEGMITTKGVLPGLPDDQWITLIGTEEKGFLNLKLTATAEGGHSSMPPRQTSIGIIAQAVAKIETHPFPARWDKATTDLLDYIGPETEPPYRVIFANRWLFGPILMSQFSAKPKSDSLIRTTIAPDVFNAGEQPASMPVTASAVVNFRMLPGDTMESVTDRVRRIINDPRVSIEPITSDEGVWETPPASTADTQSFQILSRSIREVTPDVLVTPTLMTGGSDGRYFAAEGLALSWYRILPAKIAVEDIEGVHGVDERMLVSSYLDMVNTYIRLMSNFSEPSKN